MTVKALHELRIPAAKRQVEQASIQSGDGYYLDLQWGMTVTLHHGNQPSNLGNKPYLSAHNS